MRPPSLTFPALTAQRYSALFALRNKGGDEAVAALGAVFGARSALLKHEVAYVMGQMLDKKAVDFLSGVLKVCGRRGVGAAACAGCARAVRERGWRAGEEGEQGAGAGRHCRAEPRGWGPCRLGRTAAKRAGWRATTITIHSTAQGLHQT